MVESAFMNTRYPLGRMLKCAIACTIGATTYASSARGQVCGLVHHGYNELRLGGDGIGELRNSGSGNAAIGVGILLRKCDYEWVFALRTSAETSPRDTESKRAEFWLSPGTTGVPNAETSLQQNLFLLANGAHAAFYGRVGFGASEWQSGDESTRAAAAGLDIGMVARGTLSLTPSNYIVVSSGVALASRHVLGNARRHGRFERAFSTTMDPDPDAFGIIMPFRASISSLMLGVDLLWLPAKDSRHVDDVHGGQVVATVRFLDGYKQIKNSYTSNQPSESNVESNGDSPDSLPSSKRDPRRADPR